VERALVRRPQEDSLAATRRERHAARLDAGQAIAEVPDERLAVVRPDRRGMPEARQRELPAGPARPALDRALRRPVRRQDRAGRGSDGRTHYWFTVVPLEQHAEGTDLRAMEQGFVSLTPLRLDLTDYAELARIDELPGDPA
jgi:hypothetical protein